MSYSVVVRESDDLIINAVVGVEADWDENGGWAPPAGHRAVDATGESWSIGGWLTVGLAYTPPSEE